MRLIQINTMAIFAVPLFFSTLSPLSALGASNVTISLGERLQTENVVTKWAMFKGSKALEVRRPESLQQNNAVQSIVVLPSGSFRDGTIEMDIERHVGKGANPTARGFVGVAFHLSSDRKSFDAFYIRPTNGRADDQLRRNHALQYVSIPTYDFQRFRTESPGVYESYADIQPNEWIRIRIAVAGNKAGLYVNCADQPNLIVNDLKRGGKAGAVALWIGPGTIAHFKNVRVSLD
jgi:hypothetical protein